MATLIVCREPAVHEPDCTPFQRADDGCYCGLTRAMRWQPTAEQVQLQADFDAQDAWKYRDPDDAGDEPPQDR